MLLKHQPLAIVALTTLFLLFACNGHSSPVDEENIDIDYVADTQVDNDSFDPDKPDPRCEGWRRRGNFLWWEQPFCCYTYEEALSVCSQNGLEGARLPFIDELHSLLKDCENTVDEKKCAIGFPQGEEGNHDTQVTVWREWTPQCKGCEKREDGGYSVFGDRTWFWTLTTDNDWGDDSPWGIDFTYASIGRFYHTASTGSVRCVREIISAIEIDPDPNWETTCPEDDRDDVVSMNEYPDYDYMPCAEREEEIWRAHATVGASMPFDLYLGFTYITGGLELVADSPGDKDFSKLAGLKCVDYDMRISYTDELESLHGLESLIRVGSNLEFQGNSALTDIKALSKLTEVSGDLLIYSDITSLEGLQNITKVNWLNFELADVESVRGLRGLKEANAIGFHTTRYLTSFEGLENVKKVRCNIDIVDTGITSLIGLSGLESLAQECNDYNLKEENLPALRILTCPNLISLEGMESLTQIPADFEMGNNENLETLAGLEKITFLDGDLIIDQNKTLKALTGLENLKMISESIRITSNANLTDITALYNLESLGSDLGKDLVIIYNPKLPTCQCEHLRSLLMEKGWNGFYDFTGTDETATCD